MEKEYLYETFSAESGRFDEEFTNYLNTKRRDFWKVKHCSFCHDNPGGKLWASCIFKRKT
jgi:hypothetical protein